MDIKLKMAAKHWCFTLNNYTSDDEERLRVLTERDTEYLIFGREKSSTGTPHLQGYLRLRSKKTMLSLKKLMGLSNSVYLAKKKGTAVQAAEYCKKDGDFEEFGKLGDQGRRSDLDKVVDMVKTGSCLQEIAEECPVEYIKFGRGIRDLKLQLESAYEHHECRGVWIHGSPGTGKSHSARAFDSGAFIKSQSKWWDGYQGETTVILDDLDTPTLGHHLKIWTDKYACTGETKGGTIHLRYKTFIITSNYTPEELWPEDPVMAAAVSRRCEVIHKPDRDTNIMDRIN